MNQSRHHGIFQATEFRKQVMKLKHKPDPFIPERSQFLFRPFEDILFLEQENAGRRVIQCSQDMNQCAFP